jgi:hypothetical protein
MLKETLIKSNCSLIQMHKKLLKKQNLLKYNNKYIFESKNNENILISNGFQLKNINTKKEFKNFYLTPWNIYKNDDKWIPSVYMELNDFFKKQNLFWSHAETELFVAKINNKPVGRIAAFVDDSFCRSINQKVGFFGFFECVNDYKIAKFLFKSAEEWLLSKNVQQIIGPINGRIDMGCGLLYKGFHHNQIFPDLYSPKYYNDFVENYGFNKLKDFNGYYIDLTKPIPNELVKIAQYVKNKNVKIRKFNRLKSKKEIEWWSKFMISSFIDHWGYTPVNKEEIKSRYGVKNIRWFVDNNLFLIAEKDDVPIGFSWTFPDYNKFFKTKKGKVNIKSYLNLYLKKYKIREANMNIIGINKEFHNNGIASLLNYSTISELKKRGYKGAEIGITDEENIASQKIIQRTGAKLHKIYRVYEKRINT